MLEIYTTAPVDYDWGWTQMVADEVALFNEKFVRLVEITDEYHAEMQRGRYSSGMHPSWTPVEFQREVDRGYMKTLPDPIEYHRTTIDLRLYEDQIFIDAFDGDAFYQMKDHLQILYGKNLEFESRNGGLLLDVCFIRRRENKTSFEIAEEFQEIIDQIWQSTNLKRES